MNRILANKILLVLLLTIFSSAIVISAQDRAEKIREKAFGNGNQFVSAPTNEARPEVLASQALLVDDFTATSGTLLTATGWVNHSGTTNFIPTASPGGLSYPGYPSSGIGNAASMTTTGEDVNKQIPAQTTGAVYAAAMVNVSASQTTGDYFFHVFEGAVGSGLFRARVFAKKDPASANYAFGIQKGSTANAVYTGFTFVPGTTHLIVVKYTFLAGPTNDTVDLIIDPTLGGAEPAATVSAVVDTTVDSVDLRGVALRQGTAANAPTLQIDGIRLATSWASLLAPAPNVLVDFNGDGRSDYAVIRDVGGQMIWYILTNGTGAVSSYAWGLTASDKPVPADFDGDGKSDIAIWRQGTQSYYYILQSATNTVKISPFGQNNDDTSVVGDYDGDGKADESVYRCPQVSPGQCVWYYRGSLNNPSGNITYVPWGFGVSRVVQPAAGDYDGDGKFDFCVRPDSILQPIAAGGAGPAQFILLRSSDFGVEWINWGLTSDAIVPRGDYDGDGKTDFAVARFTSPVSIYILQRNGGGTGAAPIQFGSDGEDWAAFGDYDGDGKTDIGLWRETTGQFWIRNSSNGAVGGPQFGQFGDSVPAEWIFPNS